MKVYILDLGTIELDMNFMVANTVVGTNSNKEPTIKWGSIPVLAALIDHPDGKILYDTGSNFRGMEYWPAHIKEVAPFHYRPEQEITKQLAMCNTKPDEIKTVILSHMHLDHAGNLDMFKKAEVIIHRDELAHALTTVHAATDPTAHGFYIKSEVDVEVTAYSFVYGDTELCDGVELIHLPGHSPGLMALLVHLKNSGSMILTQDACYTEMNLGPPFRHSGIAYDSKAYIESLEKLRLLIKKHKAVPIFGHDIKQMDKLKLAPLFYD